MTVTIQLKGADKFREALSAMSDDVKAEVGKEVMAVALELRTDVIKSVQQGPASGRVYQKYKPRRVHQASAPGEAPASDTGRLANSIFFDKEGPLTATVGSLVTYAAHLEYKPSNMGGRPFFRPAVEKMRADFDKRISAAVERALR